jgi:hypothetical protein
VVVNGYREGWVFITGIGWYRKGDGKPSVVFNAFAIPEAEGRLGIRCGIGHDE